MIRFTLMIKALRALSERVSQLDEANPILYGPLNKNEETKQLEHIGRELIKNWKNSSSRVQGRIIYVDVAGKTYNLNTILQKANLQQIVYSDEEIDAVKDQFSSFNPRVSDVPLAYQSVVYDYTRGHTYFNDILRNAGIDTGYFNPDVFLLRLRDTCLLLGYLNTPNQTPLPDFVVRGEEVFCADQHANRITSASIGGVTTNLGFLSTSNAKEVHKGFRYGSVSLCFVALRGKDVSKISPFPQNEVILPPCQLRWLFHYNDGKDRFTAQIVDTPSSEIAYNRHS